MEFALTDEQREIRSTVRKLAQSTFRDRASQYNDGTFPWDNMKDLAELGVLGMAIPEEYGGSDMSVFDTAIVLEEIAKVCYVTAMAALGEVGSQARIINRFAPESIKSRILPRVAAGDAILAICMTEPHTGTDLNNLKTNATRVGNDKVRLRGVKTLISRANVAEGFVVFTRVDDRPGGDGIGCVYVDRESGGIQVTSSYHTMGGEHLFEIQFEDCELPIEHLILESDGVRKLLSVFNTQRCLNPSISLGLAEGALDESLKYMRERSAFGQPVGDFQGMRWKIAEMYRDIEAARSVLYRACVRANPFPDPIESAVAKITCNEMSQRVTSEAIQIHGGYGFVDEYPVSRFFRAARYGSLGGGTTESLKNLIGKALIDRVEDVEGIAGLAGL
jgi:alkylation response protein AidB-like acyl-CoA dehydrogenase